MLNSPKIEIQMTPRWIWTTCLLVVAGISFAADKRGDTIPKDIQHAEQKLTNWMNEFKDQTPTQIRKTLGAPEMEETWEFEKKKEPLLHYKVSDTTKLSIYFHQGKAVKIGLHLLP